MTDIATYLGTAIGIIGLVIAFWQHRQRKQLEHVIRANNWFNYARSNNATGNIQLALTLYKENHTDNLSPEVIEQLAKADAFGQ